MKLIAKRCDSGLCFCVGLGKRHQYADPAHPFWLLRARKPSRFLFLPMLFVLAMTSWALGRILLTSADKAGASIPALVNAIASGALLLLAAFLLWTGVRRLRASA